MNKKLVAVSIGTLLLLTGCGEVAKLENGEEVVGSVKGMKVTADELYTSLKKIGGTNEFINLVDTFIANKEIKDSEELETEAKSQLETLKMQYESSGQSFDDAMKTSGYDSEKDLLKVLILDLKKKQVIENYIKDNLTEAEIKDYYDAEITGEISAKHILITPVITEEMTEEEKAKAKEDAKEKAEKVIKKLNAGEKFNDLVKEYSDDEGSVENDGLIENITAATVVEPFFEACIDLKDGKYTSKPVESQYGYHVILRVSQKEKPSLKDVESDIKETLMTNILSADQKLFTTAWEDIRKEYELNIEDSEIKKEYKDLIK